MVTQVVPVQMPVVYSVLLVVEVEVVQAVGPV